MKHVRPPKTPKRLAPHVRDIVKMLRRKGAEDIVVTHPKHYRIEFDLYGRRHHIPAASSPRVPEDDLKWATRTVERLH